MNLLKSASPILILIYSSISGTPQLISIFLTPKNHLLCSFNLVTEYRVFASLPGFSDNFFQMEEICFHIEYLIFYCLIFPRSLLLGRFFSLGGFPVEIYDGRFQFVQRFHGLRFCNHIIVSKFQSIKVVSSLYQSLPEIQFCLFFKVNFTGYDL